MQFEDEDDQENSQKYAVNKISEYSSTIFLNRNLVKMKRLRKSNHKIETLNGLIARIVPLAKQLTFETQTEDTLVVTR